MSGQSRKARGGPVAPKFGNGGSANHPIKRLPRQVVRINVSATIGAVCHLMRQHGMTVVMSKV
jgi:hypothetical protein